MLGIIRFGIGVGGGSVLMVGGLCVCVCVCIRVGIEGVVGYGMDGVKEFKNE